MANGWGGRRPGAGRPRKDPALRALDGNAGHRKVVAHPSAPPARPTEADELLPIGEEHAPDDLSFEERRAWLQLAPLAREKRTLTKANAFAFSMLCRNIVLERQYANSVTDRGSASHRGLIQIIDRELQRFGLAPCGAPTAAAPAAPTATEDPIKAKYFG